VHVKVSLWQLLEFVYSEFVYISYSAMAEQIRGAAPAEVTVTLLETEDDLQQVGLR
jgi:hypothetical protein